MSSSRTGKKNGRASDPKRRSVLILAAVGAALLALLLIVSATVCLRLDLGKIAYKAFAFSCCAVSAFFVGCWAGKAVGKSGLIYGTIVGVPQILLLLILCLALYQSVGIGFWIAAALILFCGGLGSILFVNTNRRCKYRYKK